ncbi:MAG: hypothetical protein ACJ748_16215 [Flavisolibacter sp.]
MKSLIISLSLAFMLIANTSKAGEINVSPVVISSFHGSFENATQVKWSLVNGLYKAEFSVDNQFITGYFNEEGNLVAVTENISSENLPASLKSNLKNQLGNQYWITELFKVTDDTGTHYFATIQNGDNKMIIRSQSNNKWVTYKKVVTI